MCNLSIIEQLPKIIDDGQVEAERILKRSYVEAFTHKEKIIPECSYNYDWLNQFYQGDNLLAIEKLLKSDYRSKLDLIYIDPPFLTNAKYKAKIVVNDGENKYTLEQFAYSDVWKDGLLSYLQMLYIRLYLMRELLSARGSIYIHLDYRTVHYVKILMDQIFGEENFLNEIIWSYKSGGVSKRYYSRKHDTILVYTRGKDYIFNPQLEKSYNRGLKPYRFKGVKEYEDKLGWYTLVNLKDVWQIDMVGRTAKERVDYATQKPERLLERIILTSSDEDSIVADFFAGSGTTGIVAERLNRRWILADNGDLSGAIINKRLVKNRSLPFINYKFPDKAMSGGKLSVKNIEIVNDKKGIHALNIELDKYKIDISKINIKDKFKDKVKYILQKKPLALIDFIGIDTDYNGYIPVFNWQNYRNNGKPIIKSNIRIKDIDFKESRKIYIKYIDIFGNENFNIYQINNERVVLCQED
ncbi:site-specific DNA-methyltransferase [Schnuerera sp. xch1]|uniref:DNA methyltransferase n=1 Tax=Schnuerera sp. xch1 TaxID=2874283 RepID=UPI001CBF87D7|nr:site-specific DNA-methyltransferase [Schnuerera sp. xch1]MBZ2174475.1 site-specific DNA-methyltransferase [Schnuerera sp. xch1]